MKQVLRKAKLCAAVATAAASLASVQSLLGANLTWDTASGDGTAITAGSGTWDLNTTANWNDGATPNVAWTATDTAIFLDETNAATSNITVYNGAGGSDVINVAGMQFNSNGFTVGFGGTGSLTLAGGTTTGIDVASGVTGTISAQMDGATVLQKTGLGTLVLNNTLGVTGGFVPNITPAVSLLNGGGQTAPGGVTRLGASNILPTASAIAMWGADLDLNNTNQTVTGISWRTDSSVAIGGGNLSTGTGTLTLTDSTISTDLHFGTAVGQTITLAGNIQMPATGWTLRSAGTGDQVIISANLLGGASTTLNLNQTAGWNTPITLSGNNTFGGDAFIGGSGQVIANTTTALGANTAGRSVQTQAGSNLRLAAPGTYAQNFVINTSTSQTANMSFASGNYTLSGNISSGGGNAALFPDYNTTITINGNITTGVVKIPDSGTTTGVEKGIKIVVNGAWTAGSAQEHLGDGMTLELNNPSNTFNGQAFTIGWNGGGMTRLVIGADGAAGTASNTWGHRGLVASLLPTDTIGDTTEFRSNYSYSKTWTWEGNGVNGTGGLYNSGGNHTMTQGVIRPTGQFASVGVESGTTWTINANLNAGDSWRNLGKVGLGTLVLDPLASGSLNGASGRIIVDQGTVVLNKSYVMRTPSSAGPYVIPGSYGIVVGLRSHGIASKVVLGTDLLTNKVQVGTAIPTLIYGQGATHGATGATMPDPVGAAGAALPGTQSLDLNGKKMTVYNAFYNSSNPAVFDNSPTLWSELVTAVNAANLGLSQDSIYDNQMFPANKLGIRMIENLDDAANGTWDTTTSAFVPTTGDGIGAINYELKVAVRADANGDGIVDVADLGILGVNWGKTRGTGAGQVADLAFDNADFNYDGIVDVADLGIMGQWWGQTYPGVSGSAGSFAEALKSVGLDGVAIPEPSGLSLLALGGLGLMRRRRRS